MKTPVSTRRSRRLLAAACAAAALIGASATQSQTVGPAAPRAAKPPTAVVTQSDWVITVDPKVIAAFAESAYLQKLTDEFIKRCTGKAVGCAIAAVGPNGMWSEGAAGDARRSPDGSPRKLTANDKITMASVSKTFTGAALQKLLYTKRISIDAKIGPYLPKDWKRTALVDKVTFRQLLTHKSGLPCNGVTDDLLKSCLASATQPENPPLYHNENFALMRILIPEILGTVTTADGFTASYAQRYRNYVNQTVFAPAGLPWMQCKATDALPALSYKSATSNTWDFSKVGPGEVWGDMGAVCGSQGWFLSARQMAQTMSAIMTPGKILHPMHVERMKTDKLAVKKWNDGSVLSWYHDGFHPAGWNKGEINTLIMHFDNGVSAGVIINSPYGSGNTKGDYIGDLVASFKAAG